MFHYAFQIVISKNIYYTNNDHLCYLGLYPKTTLFKEPLLRFLVFFIRSFYKQSHLFNFKLFNSCSTSNHLINSILKSGL